MDSIVSEETGCLARVLGGLAEAERPAPAAAGPDYDTQLLSLRDQLSQARLEDIPPLVEQMERLALLAAQRRSRVEPAAVDPASPYFARLVLSEGGRQREVLIGRTTYVDAKRGLRIVDWRDAPVSRVYYRYQEGEEYSETFGARVVDGEVLVRRSLTIAERELRRITCPQGTFVPRQGTWVNVGEQAHLQGGEGSALRAEQHHRPGKLGGAGADLRDDKHLREITALIDRRQFELITHRDSGLVVIQGGAGSGKTTIGLHRLAYLAFQDPRRFRPERMLVVVFNDALARYIARVLPALGLPGIAVRTYTDWASRLRRQHVPALRAEYSDEGPGEVARLKKHPAMLRAIDAWTLRLGERLGQSLDEALGRETPAAERQLLLARWQRGAGRPVVHRLHDFASLSRERALGQVVSMRVETALKRALKQASDLVGAWGDLLTDHEVLAAALAETPVLPMSPAELRRAERHLAEQVKHLLAKLESDEDAEEEAQATARPRGSERPRGSARPSELAPRRTAHDDRHQDDADDEDADSSAHRGTSHGVDGALLEAPITVDREDDTLLLRLHQRLLGPLMRGGDGVPLSYEHVFADEAQDLSPVELAVVLDTVSNARCVTLSGDTAQRLYMDNGFTSWEGVLAELGLAHVAVEPLELSYRSTHEIVDFARAVLGPLAPTKEPVAPRHGAPVELFRFSHSGDAVGFLAEELRDLLRLEPNASVAVIARFPEHADLYYAGLSGAELTRVRRVAEQDFCFKPGVDVTDVRQVKGLEFDYVVLVEANAAVYPEDDESRHLLHIAATRAAHQLWLVTTGKPSPLLPPELRQREY